MRQRFFSISILGYYQESVFDGARDKTRMIMLLVGDCHVWFV